MPMNSRDTLDLTWTKIMISASFVLSTVIFFEDNQVPDERNSECKRIDMIALSPETKVRRFIA
jgi:hypothetical protein